MARKSKKNELQTNLNDDPVSVLVEEGKVENEYQNDKAQQ